MGFFLSNQDSPRVITDGLPNTHFTDLQRGWNHMLGTRRP